MHSQSLAIQMLLGEIVLDPSSWVSWHSSLGTPRQRCGACGDRIRLWYISFHLETSETAMRMKRCCALQTSSFFFHIFVRGRIL